MSNQISVEDLIDGAIVAGFRDSVPMFLESLESELENSVIISEAGDAQTLLQAMIDDVENDTNSVEVNEQLSELDSKLSRILRS